MKIEKWENERHFMKLLVEKRKQHGKKKRKEEIKG